MQKVVETARKNVTGNAYLFRRSPKHSDLTSSNKLMAVASTTTRADKETLVAVGNKARVDKETLVADNKARVGKETLVVADRTEAETREEVLTGVAAIAAEEDFSVMAHR